MSELTQVLRQLLPVEDPNALVDASTRDDAAVYRLSDDRAVVVTVDFFTPVVDDPFDFGRIGAANALSDLYAMAARPLFALNLVGFPRKHLGEGVLEDIVRGGASVAAEAGIPILGGHSIDDPEPKFGMVAVGEVDPARMLTNRGALPGDVLVLTKPLGSGVIATAIKAGVAPPDVVAEAVRWMATLNREAATAMVAAGAHAATDVTGYGLLGHLRNVLLASDVAAELEAGAAPLLAGALRLAAEGHIPGGSQRNRADLAELVEVADTVDEVTTTLLFDAQTSGGLLIALDEARAPQILERIPGAAVIGRVVAGTPGTMRVE